MNLDCRGDKNKEAIVRDYFLKPLIYSTLLEEQEKLGCCGKLEREYYVFRAKHKKNNNEFSFFVGKHCAEKFLLLINHPKLDLFNLFISETENEHTQNNSNDGNSGLKKIHPINKELIEAIHILTTAWNSPPPSSVITIIEFTHNNEGIVNKMGIKWFNEKLAYDKQKRTMTEIYLDLKNANKKIRNFSFEKLKSYFSDSFPNETNRY